MNIEVNASVSNHEKNPKDKLGDEQVKIFETAGGEEQGFVPTLGLCSALDRLARMEVQLTPLTNAAADFLSL